MPDEQTAPKCHHCDAPALPGRSMCEACREKSARENHARRNAERDRNTIVLVGGSAMTVGQMARVLGCSHRTVAKQIDTGALKGYRLPGSRDRRVRPDDIETSPEAIFAKHVCAVRALYREHPFTSVTCASAILDLPEFSIERALCAIAGVSVPWRNKPQKDVRNDHLFPSWPVKRKTA